MLRRTLFLAIPSALILGLGILATASGAWAAAGPDRDPGREHKIRQEASRKRPPAPFGARDDFYRRHLFQRQGRKPNLWQLREALPAPQMKVDPQAPVVNVASEAAAARMMAGDLDPTIDVQITQEIIDKANELGTVRAMYEFVRNECEFQPYYGSQKGSVETLRQRSGNDYDLASLLIALLRASGIPARYGEGQVELSVEQASSWLAVDDPGVAGSILFTHGMEGISIVASSTNCCFNNGTPGCDDPGIEACVCATDPFCCGAGGGFWDQQCADQVDSFGCAVCDDLSEVVAVRAQRVWVEAFASHGFGSPTWVPLDPAFTLTEIHPGLDIPQEMGLDAQEFIEDYWDPADVGVMLPRPETPLELLEAAVMEFVDTNHPGLTLDDVMRTHEIVPEHLGILPNSLPYIVRSRDGEYSEIPTDRRYQVRFHLYDGSTSFIDHTVNLPEVAGKRITISYEGAAASDQAIIDSFNGLLFTPPNMINIRPLLKIDGQTVATGAAGIGAGRIHDSDVHFMAPVNAGGLPQNVIPAIFNTIVAGELQAVGLAVQGVFNPIFVPENPADLEGFIAQERFSKAMSYLERGIAADDRLGELLHATVAQDVIDAIVKDDILVVTDGFGNPISWQWSGLTIDADRLVLGVWKVDEYEPGCGGEGKEVLVLGGAQGSLNESLIYETDYEQEAVSTIKILELAVDQGITVYKRWNNPSLPPNTQPSSVRTAIQNAIVEGHEVTFPADPITYFNWTGTGYIDMDPCTGAAGYIIAGGQNGGSTVDTWTDIIWDFSPCTVDSVQGRVITPAQDSPDPGALFCKPDKNKLVFEYDLRIEYKINEQCPTPTFGSWTRRNHRSKSPSQLDPDHYFVIVGDKGDPANDQHKRKLSIIEAKIKEVVRGSGLPNSVSPTKDKVVEVTITPESTATLEFTVENTGSGNGSASITANAMRTTSGPITVTGSTQTTTGKHGKLVIRANLSGDNCGESKGFSVCAHPNAVENGPAHSPVNTVTRAGMSINITIKSDSGNDADLNQVQDGEVVSLSYGQTGSFMSLAPLPSSQSGFQQATAVPPDQHTVPKAFLIDRFDNHGGAGLLVKGQLDKFYDQRCGMTAADAQVIPNSGYEIVRELIATGGQPTKIDFKTLKRPAAVSVGGFATGAGPSATQSDTVNVRP